jgi:ketosteroid isomerase-like protein
MPRAKYPASNAGAAADDTEAAFYEALQRGDIGRLMACWADEDDIVCVHPGGPRVLGALAIRSSFEAIFANGSVRAFPESVRRVQTMGCAMHNLIERIEVLTSEGQRQAFVVATNVYVKTAQGWRMVVHHASPGSAAEAAQAGAPAQTLH